MPTTFCFVAQSACASHGVGFAHYALMGHGSAGGPARGIFHGIISGMCRYHVVHPFQ